MARDGARRLIRPRFVWPAALRSKWLSIALFVSMLFAYELFDLWAHPSSTALLIVAYFAAITVIDALFIHAPFCKWVCPIGQFNFVASLLSPFEVKAKDAAACSACRTKDCIRGRRDETGAVAQRGCELALYLPRKIGNLDCTFCLDCAYACPHDNVAVQPRFVGEELWLGDVRRSGIGRTAHRRDIAALIAVFTFGALLNAFGMVSPVYAFADWLARTFGIESDLSVLIIIYALGMLAMPAILIFGTAALSKRLCGSGEPVSANAVRHVYALAPLAFGIWLAHYSFHFLTGIFSFVPVAQRALLDAGVTIFGSPAWALSGLSVDAAYPIELGFVGLGAVMSIFAAFKSARGSPAGAAPWAGLVLALLGASVWLLSQPMEMRGTFFGG